MKLRNILIAACGLAAATGAASAASAMTPWQNHHLRRVEVNHRLTDLNRRITYDRLTGRISATQAHYMHLRVRHVRLQEKRIAWRQDGHVGYRQQVRLNREENGVGRHVPA